MAKQQALERLIAELEQVTPAARISLREAILAHGKAAADPLVAAVVRRPDLGLSVTSWFENLARRPEGDRPTAVAVLRRLAALDPGTGRYATEALARLGLAPSPIPERRSGGLPASAGTDWPGFQKHEFGRNAGTQWRGADGRRSLAPILTRELRKLHPDFMSYGVERRPELHFALAGRYRGDAKAGFTSSKLVVYAHGPNGDFPDLEPVVAAGWYIERGGDEHRDVYGDPVDATRWDWPLFLNVLQRSGFQSRLTEVMERHALRFGPYLPEQFAPAVPFVAKVENGEIVGRRTASIAGREWDFVADTLAAIPAALWVDLHIWRTWPAEEAVAVGQPFALRELAPVLTDLAELYLLMLGSAIAGRDWTRDDLYAERLHRYGR